MVKRPQATSTNGLVMVFAAVNKAAMCKLKQEAHPVQVFVQIHFKPVLQEGSVRM